jgi:HK97 family phage major capsid protein
MTLLAMRGELETLKARAQAIIDQYGAGGLTAEKNEELTKLTTKCVELSGQIKAERELDEKKADLGRIDDFLNAPQYRVPVGVGNGEDDTHRVLRQAGWESKSGILYAPTSMGVMQPMYAEEVLTGDMPTDVTEEVANFFRTTRRAFQPDYRKAYTHFLRLCGRMHDAAMAWTRLDSDEQKALSEGTDTAGGFLVPPDAQAEMLVRLPQQAAVRRAGARVQSTSRDVLRWPMVQPAAATAGGLASGGGSIFSSGFIGGWAGETPAFVDTDPAFGSFDVAVRKLRVATKLSNDFLSDAMVNPLTFLSENGSSNMALVEDQGFLSGDGSSLQPLGLLNTSGISTVDVEGSTTDTISNTSAAAGSAPKIIDVEYALPSQYIPGAKWMLRRSIEGKIRKLIDGSGRFLWPGVLQSGFSMPQKEIDGYPVLNSEFVPADGTNANKVIIFGDFSNYIIAQRAQITTTVLRERFADTDQTGIILWERVGGACWNTDAFRFGIV